MNSTQLNKPPRKIAYRERSSEAYLNLPLQKQSPIYFFKFLLFYNSILGRLSQVSMTITEKYTFLHVTLLLLANVNSRSRSLYAIARPSVVCRLSVVCNARAPYSGGSSFLQYFYGIWYLGYPLTSTENFTKIVPREPLRRGS